MKIHTLVLGAYATNTYIIENNGEAAVIDPAADARKILNFLQDNGLELKYVLVTHAHFDHIGAVKALQDAGATVYMSETDYDIIEFGEYSSVFGAPQAFNLDVAVKDGESFFILEHEFKVMETPGHTPGGVCYITDNGFIFSGDTLFRQSIGRADFQYGDYSTLIKSVKKLLELPYDYNVLPGHGEPTKISFERNYNPYAN